MKFATSYINPMTPSERAYYSQHNPLFEESTVDIDDPIDLICDSIDRAIAEKLGLGECYFQVLIPQDPFIWINSTAIKLRFKRIGIFLSWRLFRGLLIIYVQATGYQKK